MFVTEPVDHAIVTVRVSSSRLPQKCLLEFGEGNVLQHVIRRACWAGFCPIVATTDKPEDDVIESIAADEKVRCFRGSEKDKLRRWLGACEAFKINCFHTIDADDPFFDGDLGHRSLHFLTQGNYDVVYPSSKTYLASVGYSLTTRIVEEACRIKNSEDTEMMWYHVEKVPNLKGAELQVEDARIRDVRLTLDYEEDYCLLRTVLRILGPEANRYQIEALFLENPQLSMVNWFRNEEWKKGQEAKRI